jgi:alkylhydroperoxidase/carboxymuconolactone decarboxylase family protein YurZ
MIGICCALRVQRGMRIHADRALTLGVTPKQVLEAIEVAAIPGGMPGLWLGAETLKEVLDQRGQAFE